MTQASPWHTACPVPVVGFPRECSRGSRASTRTGSPRVPRCPALGWAAGGSASPGLLWAAGKNWSENRNRQKGSNFAVKHPSLLEGDRGRIWERRPGSQSKMRPSLLWSNRRCRLQGSCWKCLIFLEARAEIGARRGELEPQWGLENRFLSQRQMWMRYLCTDESLGPHLFFWEV